MTGRHSNAKRSVDAAILHTALLPGWQQAARASATEIATGAGVAAAGVLQQEQVNSFVCQSQSQSA